jgi:activator of HSP90 ATPase
MKTIKQHYFINATPEEVFSAITNPFTIELWSGYPAIMEAKEGTEFSIFDGDISGRNIKITENLQLVQEWYFGERPEQSIVTIDLKPHQMGTKVILEHTNIPDEELENFNEGWNEYYWGAIREFFK